MFLMTKKRHQEEVKKIVDKWGTVFKNAIGEYDADFNKIESILINFAQFKNKGVGKYSSPRQCLRDIVEIIEARKARGKDGK
jgi:hypothetical protein|tara:strand:- start:758 stop:1003 length:246 start_codon:yes stop_codon:yes gene_type:complete